MFNPNDTKKKQLLIKVFVGIGIAVVVVGFTALSSGEKRAEFVKQQEAKAKIEATTLVSEDDLVKTNWIGNVSTDVDIVREDAQKILKENDLLKKRLDALEKLIKNANQNNQNNQINNTETNQTKKDIKNGLYFGMDNGTKSDNFVGKQEENSGLFKDFPKPYQDNVILKPKEKTESQLTKMSGDMLSIVTTNAIEEEEKKEEEKKEEVEYLPTGTISKVLLLNGFDAPTMSQAKTNPLPILMKVTDLSILPNRFKYDLAECFIMGEGYGDLSSERVYIRTNNLSCVTNNGNQIDIPFKGMVTGEDGKAGLRGRVVSKQGAALARTIIANFVSSVGTAFGNQGQSITDSLSSLTGQTTTTTSDLNAKDTLKAGAYNGLAGGANKLAEFYLKLADQTAPVIEIDSKRRVEVISTSRTKLTINPQFEEKKDDK